MKSKSTYIIVVLLLAFAIAAWFLKTIIIYIIISIILSLIGHPLVRFFTKIKIKKLHISNSIAAALALITMLIVVLAFFSMFIPLVIQEARIVNKINPNEVMATFKYPLQNLEYDLKKFQLSPDSGQSIQQYLTTKLSSVLGFNEISSFIQKIIGFTGGILAAFFSILFITFFLLKDEKLIFNIIILLKPTRHIEAVKTILNDTKLILTRYFIGILLDVLLVATLTAISLSLCGIQNALLIGVFAGVLNVIPYIGPLIAAGFAVLIGVSTNLNLDFYSQLIPLAEKIVVVFLIIQLIDAMVFQPLIISSRVKAHPLEIFIVILIASKIAGITGMIIAIPVYTIIRIIAKEFLSKFKFIQQLTADLEKSIEKNSFTPPH
jgi:predicted PurR-regulated permease PerM